MKKKKILEISLQHREEVEKAVLLYKRRIAEKRE